MRQASMSRSSVIGVMTTRYLDERRCIDLLTSNERTRWAAIKNEERRKGWLGGRLVAKYQFLTTLGSGDETDDGRVCHPQLRTVDMARLEAYPPWAYREIEVLPPPCTPARVPQLSWIGRRQPVRVSLSHTCGLAGAYLTGPVPAGLDIESSCRRCPPFYRGNFSPWERRWAEGLRTSGPVDADRVYTLLWCLKEAALKSQRSAEVSVLQMPLIEVRPNCSAVAVCAVLHSGQLGSVLVFAQVEIRQAGTIALAEVAIAAAGDAILAALWVREEA